MSIESDTLRNNINLNISKFICISEDHYKEVTKDINKSIDKLLKSDDSKETQDKIDKLVKIKEKLKNRFKNCAEREYFQSSELR